MFIYVSKKPSFGRSRGNIFATTLVILCFAAYFVSDQYKNLIFEGDLFFHIVVKNSLSSISQLLQVGLPDCWGLPKSWLSS